MSSSTFLSNDDYWRVIADRIKQKCRIDAAVAYLGRGAARLLPLRRGDRLVVDMSLATVTAGGTDPHEIETLTRRGVEVYTRRYLHCKIIVGDHFVIAGSANASSNSKNRLDEAGILTNDELSVLRARKFVDRLCTELVLPEYLAECKRRYKPPRFGGITGGKEPQSRANAVKLWIANLYEGTIPDAEIERYERGVRKAKSLIFDKRSETDEFHWSSKPKMADDLHDDGLIIQVVTWKDQTTLVYPPAKLLLIDDYVRDHSSGKERVVFHLAVPRRGEAMPWKQFRRAAKFLFSSAQAEPRTRPIRDIEVADRVLRLWTPGGRISRSAR